jgi:hypothetical protein
VGTVEACHKEEWRNRYDCIAAVYVSSRRFAGIYAQVLLVLAEEPSNGPPKRKKNADERH